MNEIPKHIAKLVEDIDWSKDFIFEKMPCDHDINAAEYLKVNCNKCNFDKTETWLENELTNMTIKDTMTEKDGKVKTITKIRIMRGRYNDCIGILKDY